MKKQYANTYDNRKAPGDLNWSALLVEAVTKPGTISKAYTAFWRYSVGNQMLAMAQCAARGIEVGPLNSFNGWKKLGRKVKKGLDSDPLTGKKAIVLCFPTKKRIADDDNGDAQFITRFLYRPHWFVLSQTEGDDMPEVEVPGWDRKKALIALDLREVDFTLTDGNVLGYATQNGEIAINPIGEHKDATRFHELGHQVLGHCKEGSISDGEKLSRNIQEVEAESVSYILTTVLGVNGQADESRGYIQNWLKDKAIPEKSCQRIFAAANKILKAGQETVEYKN